jgi:hypothetical protein
VLLLLAVIRNLGRGVACQLKKAITILRDRHSPLNSQRQIDIGRLTQDS